MNDVKRSRVRKLGAKYLYSSMRNDHQSGSFGIHNRLKSNNKSIGDGAKEMKKKKKKQRESSGL